MYMECYKCGTTLQCMEGGGGMADFDCPKCNPASFRPWGQSLEEWKAERMKTQENQSIDSDSLVAGDFFHGSVEV